VVFWDVPRPSIAVIGEWISLIFALLTVLFWISVAGVLHRRGIRLQV
jgi:hypothetical protein